MILQKLVLQLYTKLHLRIHIWILPGLLTLSTVSAFCLQKPQYFSHIPRIYLTKFHLLSGFLLTSVSVFVLYNALLTLKKTSGSDVFSKQFQYAVSVLRKRFSWERLNDIFFYFLLAIAVVSGLILHLSKQSWMEMFFPEEASITIVHQLIFWYLISMAVIKYFLVLKSWIIRYKQYLQEF